MNTTHRLIGMIFLALFFFFVTGLLMTGHARIAAVVIFLFVLITTSVRIEFK